ncbi:MAG: hypothetical protein F6K31_18445 [Symploca sp. SIO2G7]|nr:hypothetical protein [Symploca sp. SIO2G7]
MSYLHYVVPAAITFLITLYAFLKDTNAPKNNGLNWAFVIVTGLLWPITLPFIIWKRLSSLFKLNSAEISFRRHHWI